MMWLVTLIVLALLAWLVVTVLRRNADVATTERDPLEHDRDGLNQPLPGQRAATDGEVADAARTHVGGHLETHPEGVPSRDSDLTGTDLAADERAGAGGRPAADADDLHRVGASVRTEPAPPTGSDSIATGSGDDGTRDDAAPDGSDTERPLDADAAARAARDTRDTGGTGTAVLAGIATAAGAAGAAAAAGAAGTTDHAAHDEGADRTGADHAATDHAGTDHAGTDHAGTDHAGADRSDADHAGTDRTGAADRSEAERADAGGDVDPAERVNRPDPDTAGSLELDGRIDGPDASPRESDRSGDAGGSSDAGDAAAETSPETRADDDTPSGERDPERDDARTNAPVGDTTAGDAARDPVEPVPASADGAGADAPADAEEPDERTNAPDLETAGAGVFRDRSGKHRSNLVAGTATLGVGGATASDGAAILEDGHTPAENAARLHDAGHASSGAEPLEGGDTRTNVREMMKILNLRESDASRLDISKDDFARLWQGDGAAPDTLVDDVAARLRRMLG